jgi:hypothetical protein
MAEMTVVAILPLLGGVAAGCGATVALGLLPSVVQPETASSTETSATRIFMQTTGFLELRLEPRHGKSAWP